LLGRTFLAAAALVAAIGVVPEVSAQCSTALQNYTGSDSVACPCFIPGEQAGAVFDIPAAEFPIEILKVGVGWESLFGGSPPSMEQAIHIYEGGLPDPGVPIFSLPGPQLTDGSLNEFDLEPLPGEILVNSGPFAVTLEFLNQNAGDVLAPTVAYDGNGCQPGKNVVFVVPGGWLDSCFLGVPGDWVFFVVYRSASCGLCENPAPRSQGYWHRQCLGVPAGPDPATSGIDPGRNGRGPQAPVEPEFTKELMPAVNALLENSLGPAEGFSCVKGMDADQANDPCERAIKQYTALLFNLESGLVQDGCEVEPDAACGAATVGQLVGTLATLITSNNPANCQLAADCAGAVNEGAAVLPTGGAESTLASVGVIDGLTPILPVTEAPPRGSTILAGEAVTLVAEPLEPPVSAPVLVGVAELETEVAEIEPSEAEEPSTLEPDDSVQAIARHLAILDNPLAHERALSVSADALLTALSGGYEPETRLEMVKALLGRVDVAYHALLVDHLEAIRAETADLGMEILEKEAILLLERFED
jgi:hypothetical protein